MVNAFRWMVFVIGLTVIIGSIMVTSAGKPIIVINSPSDGDTVYTDRITVSGGATGTDGAIVKSVEVKGELVDGTTSWSKAISLQADLNQITVKAKDNMNQSSLITISVTYIPPTNISRGGDRDNTNNNGYINTPIPMPNGSISITTIPSGAEIYWDGSYAGNAPITLEDNVGHHRIKISKEGYRSSKPMNIDLYNSITTKRTFELEPLTGSIHISSTPSGACVYLDGVDMKANTTCKLSEVVVGNHTLKLKKPDYFDVERNVPVSDNNTTYLRENLPAYGHIDISSIPFEACVCLDNVDMNATTPCVLSEVVVGQHYIKLTKSDYCNLTKNVSVYVGITCPVDINLTECGYINISSVPSGANVSVDGTYMGETPKNISKVAEGNHSIKVTKSDYFDLISTVPVSAGRTSHLYVNLTGHGSINVSSDPVGARVYLDGNFMGVTPKTISKVFEGNHSIRLTKRSYKEMTQEIHVSAENTTSIYEPLSLTFWGRKEPWIPVYLTIIGVIGAVIIAWIEVKKRNK